MLRPSEENLRTIFDHVLDGVVLFDAQGTIFEANEAWCRMHGVAIQRTTTLNIADFSSPTMSKGKHQQILEEVLTGEPQVFEWKSRRGDDGSEFDTEVYLRRIKLGDRVFLLANVRDISQRKGFEEEMLVKSTALQAAANAITITGRDGAIQWVNPAFTALTGYSAQEAIGQNSRVLKSGVHPQTFYKEMWKTILQGKTWHGELVNKRKDGTHYYEEMTITPVSNPAGVISHFIAIKHDVTERKRGEQALLNQNQRLSILNAAATALLTADAPDQALASICRQMSEFFQVDGCYAFHLDDSGEILEVVATGSSSATPLMSRFAVGEGAVGMVARTRSPIVVNDAQASNAPEFRFARERGARAFACLPLIVGERLLGTVCFSSSSRLSFDSQEVSFFQTLANYLALGMERIRLEMELREHANNLETLVSDRTAQLVETNANLQAFAHSAAHDLRSPLRTIRGFSGILAEEYGSLLGPDGRMLLERVTEATDRMNGLLNDLLEYSKLQQTELRPEPVELARSLQEVLTLLEADIRKAGAEILVRKSLAVVLGHPSTIILVLSNYISNALKFIPPGRSPKVQVWTEPAGEFARLCVEDNGIGIPLEYQQKLFLPFGRLHGKDSFPGTGLGLAIVKRAVERMGGAVGVRSEADRGSCFWAELPAVPNS